MDVKGCHYNVSVTGETNVEARYVEHFKLIFKDTPFVKYADKDGKGMQGELHTASLTILDATKDSVNIVIGEDQYLTSNRQPYGIVSVW